MLGTGRDTRVRSKQYRRLRIKKVYLLHPFLFPLHVHIMRLNIFRVHQLLACTSNVTTGVPVAERHTVESVPHSTRSHCLATQTIVDVDGFS